MTWVDAHWSLVLLASLVFGLVGSVLAVRVAAARIASGLRGAVAASEIVWGVQARERIGGGWGFAGRLVLNDRDELRFDPFPADRKRGAVSEVWSPGSARVAFGDLRPDISGLRLRMLVVTPEDGSPLEFGTGKAAGRLPDRWVV